MLALTSRTMRPGRWATLVAVAVALAVPAGAQGARPDLVADPVERIGWQDEGTGADKRRLLRFDGFIHNAGPGPLQMRASQRSGNDMKRVEQVVDGVASEVDADVLYELADFHQHWHLKAIARYSLGLPGGGPEVAPAMKVGFCLLDSEALEGAAPLYFHAECEKYNATPTDVTMGVSSNWRDVYHRDLVFQWVDVSDVQPGRYEVRTQIDPEGYVAETAEDNPVTAVPAELPGFVARARTLAGVRRDAPTTLQLAAARFGTPLGNRQVRIEAAPRQGTLDVPTGQWVEAAEVTYTPAAGATGADSFTFAARDSGSDFPRTAASATVAFGFEAELPAPAVDGPDRVVAGTSVQLTGPDGASWDVDGVPGGDLRVGTVTPAGLYTAPAVIPGGGAVTVRATAPDGRSATRVLQVVAEPPLVPAPAPDNPAFYVPAAPATPPSTTSPPAPARRASRVAIRSFGLKRTGPVVAAAVLATRTGRLRVDLRSRGRRLVTCRTRARAGVPQVCRLRIPRGAGRALTVRATLVAGGRTVVRAMRVPTAARAH